MYGDFTRSPLGLRHRDAGILHQQGRVLLDTDVNAQTAIATHWQEQAARAAFGSSIVAVPAYLGESLSVLEATFGAAGATAQVVLTPGEAWVDGVRVGADADAATPGRLTRTARYLDPVPPPADAGAAGTRDALVLEVFREAHSAFQRTELLEPALGGVDTTQRLHHALRARLVRLADGEQCEDLLSRLLDDANARGRLTVTLADDPIPAGDCPVDLQAGYTGFEHYLYRIEIAQRDAPEPKLKWSRFNGGLVGRGDFDSLSRKLTLTHNREAILRSGISSFYLEVVRYDPALGHHQVVFGANAAIDPDEDLLVDALVELGTLTSGPCFFRLWDGIEPVATYSVGSPVAFRDGLELEFDTSAGPLTPGDYWTFAVRVDAPNPPVLVDGVPEGPRFFRAPIAELTWRNDGTASVQDCRRVFNPLTRLSTCCRVRVGDGVHSHGDVRSIGEALARLPAQGGRICVLPGVYAETVELSGRTDVVIEGCGPFTRLVSPEPAETSSPAAIIQIASSTRIGLRDLAIEAHANGAGILVVGAANAIEVRELELAGVQVSAARAPGLDVRNVESLRVSGSSFTMADVEGYWPAVLLRGRDVVLEKNVLRIAGAGAGQRVRAGLGGLWLLGGCEDVRIHHNDIQGGLGHGITLGHLELEEVASGSGESLGLEGKYGRRGFYDEWAEAGSRRKKVFVGGWLHGDDGPCGPCEPGSVDTPEVELPPGHVLVAGEPLADIEIAGNRIYDMGIAGIGVQAFLDPERGDAGVIEVDGLRVLGNDIRRCLSRSLATLEDDARASMGYGAISLAAVEGFTCWDNRITEYGGNFRRAVCGIYVAYGVAVDIDRNVIMRGGTRLGTGALEPGPRGGIVVAHAEAPVLPEGSRLDAARGEAPSKRRQLLLAKYYRVAGLEGQPALRVAGNVVSAGAGSALDAFVHGPAIVHGNRFECVAEGQSVGGAIRLGIFGTGAGWGSGQVGYNDASVAYDARSKVPSYKVRVAAGRSLLEAIEMPSLAEARLSARAAPLIAGKLLFNDNQVAALIRGTGAQLTMPILLMSTDDAGIDGNQFEARIPSGSALLGHVLAYGMTVRATANQFSEPLGACLYSAFTVGLMNTTSLNQSTHCIAVLAASAALRVATGNLELIRAYSNDVCGELDGLRILARYAAMTRT